MWWLIAQWLGKIVLKISPWSLIPLLWTYQRDLMITVGIDVLIGLAVTVVVMAVVLRVHALWAAARIRRGQQLGIYRDPDPVEADARVLRRYPAGRP